MEFFRWTEIPRSDILLNVFGVTTAYTLMNSSFGSFGSNIATIEFVAALGETATFDLIEGTNIRDHNQGIYQNTIAPGTSTAAFSDSTGDMVRLDRQDFVPLAAFATDSLTQVILTNNTPDADFQRSCLHCRPHSCRA